MFSPKLFTVGAVLLQQWEVAHAATSTEHAAVNANGSESATDDESSMDEEEQGNCAAGDSGCGSGGEAILAEEESGNVDVGKKNIFWFDRCGNWDQADAKCARQGGTLFMPKTAAEDTAGRDLCRSKRKGSCWIGITRVGRPTFRYVDGSSIGYTGWGRGEPNSRWSDRGGEQCVEMMREHNYKWNDTRCHFNLRCLCEKPSAAELARLAELRQKKEQADKAAEQAQKRAVAEANRKAEQAQKRHDAEKMQKAEQADKTARGCVDRKEIFRIDSYNVGRTFSAAQQQCRAQGGQLVVPSSAAQQAKVRSKYSPDGACWLGLVAQGNRNQWNVNAPGEWKRGEPNDAWGPDNCVATFGMDGWNDVPCDVNNPQLINCMICEKPC